MARKATETREHGTRKCYLRGPGPGAGPGCRCKDCQRANRATRIRRERAILRGQWQPFVDAGPVREHILALGRAGLSPQNVARLAGVRPTSVIHLLYGSNGSKPGRRVRPATAEAILAVQAGERTLPGAGLVDSTGTHRRVQALVAIGWSQARIAAELGMARENFSATMRGARVRAQTAGAVRELYDRLWNQLPPQGTPREAALARAARAQATAREWPPPLAWDDDRLDRPDGRPARSWLRAAAKRQLEPGVGAEDRDRDNMQVTEAEAG